MNYPRICMLGWEFPPFINGGLGVACQGLTEALATETEAQLRMIVPKTSTRYQPKGWELLGVTGRSVRPVYEQNSTVISELQSQFNIHYVDVEIAGYERPKRSTQITVEEEQLLVEKIFYEEELMRPGTIFQLRELYGDDLIDRVIEFAELAAEAGMEQEFDVIHAHDWMTFLGGLQLKAKSNKPLVLHIHSLEYDRGGEDSRGWIYELERKAMSEADRIVAVSHYTQNIIQEHYGISGKKIRVVHNGVAPYPAYRIKTPFEGALVVFLGRLTGQKGPEYFFEIAKNLLETEIKVQFVIAGRGHLIEALTQQTKAEGLGAHIHFTGFLEPDRARDLLAMANVYVMPSVSEPFGLSALEAAQMNVPCVITNQSGVGEVLSGALRADYWEIEDLTKHVQALLEDEQLRRGVIVQQKQDLTQVGWEFAAKKLIEVYQEIV